MAYYWNYNDLSQGSTISSWVDRITGLDEHQGNASLRPTNSTSGVWFTAGLRLTNVTATLPQTKFSMWLVFKANNLTTGYHCLVCSANGSIGMYEESTLGFQYYTNTTVLFSYAAGASYDFLWTDQGTGAAGAGVGYTNAVATVTSTGHGPFSWQSMGTDDANEHFQGYIKFVAIWTNKVLTATDAANLYTYSQSH